MPEVQSEKQYFSFRKGLNTVSNEISFPDEYTSDELNYTIESDGSRKRRRGLAEEASGTTATVVTIADGQANQSFKWQNAGGDPTENLFVHQIGYTLYFSDDAEIASTHASYAPIDLSSASLKVASATTAATVGSEPCSFAVHRGYLVVTNKYLKPFYIAYDGTDFTVSVIQILVRDFEGIDDGVGISTQPDTITADHYYNLINRGWKDADITAYKTNSSATTNPSKDMVWHLGYIRTYGTSVDPTTGTHSFSTAKMEAEVFGKSSAPQGSLFQDPLDTTTAVTTALEAAAVPLAYDGGDFGANPTSATTLTVALTGHGYIATDTFTISGQSWLYNLSTGGADYEWDAMNRVWTCESNAGVPSGVGKVDISNANQLVFYVSAIDGNWSAWATTAPDGQIDGGEVITNSSGSALAVGPKACEGFAGRIWYAGIDDEQWADTVFFSQVALRPESFGRCHQKADPTGPVNNQLRPDDGGTIIIPNMGIVKQLKATRSAILIFATNGIWEITGGRGGFTAESYSVRKITDAGCNAPLSVVQFESATIYTGPKGVSALSPNQYTSLLEETNMTAPILEDTWNAISSVNQETVQAAYDDAKKRLYVLYRDGATLLHTYDRALVYDLKNQGWYRLGFNYGASAGIISMFAISDADESESNQKMKFQCQITTTTVDVCDMNQSNYVDFDGTESPLPYLVTGWEAEYGFQRRKQAPIVHVFNKRTGTGWTDTGGGVWTEDNGGSTLMTPFWDWTEATQWDDPDSPTAQEPWDATDGNHGISGKIGKQVETYRHVRNFTPLASGNVTGYPILATRHKVRGRGRTLSMRFDGATGKDSHLLGFTVNYKISRRK